MNCRRQLHVVSSQNTFSCPQQRDPTAGFKGLHTLNINTYVMHHTRIYNAWTLELVLPVCGFCTVILICLDWYIPFYRSGFTYMHVSCFVYTCAHSSITTKSKCSSGKYLYTKCNTHTHVISATEPLESQSWHIILWSIPEAVSNSCISIYMHTS